MKDHEGCHRGFYWTNKAWYCTEIKANEIMFGMFHGEGGTSGEMAMVWQELSGKEVPQMRVYDDAWSALATFGDLLHELGNHDNENITPEGFINILKAYGFKDLTAYDAP